LLAGFLEFLAELRNFKHGGGESVGESVGVWVGVCADLYMRLLRFL
jgi:hypothetical protein